MEFFEQYPDETEQLIEKLRTEKIKIEKYFPDSPEIKDLGLSIEYLITAEIPNYIEEEIEIYTILYSCKFDFHTICKNYCIK